MSRTQPKELSYLAVYVYVIYIHTYTHTFVGMQNITGEKPTNLMSWDTYIHIHKRINIYYFINLKQMPAMKPVKKF